jgi:hypothetical protein
MAPVIEAAVDGNGADQGVETILLWGDGTKA